RPHLVEQAVLEQPARALVDPPVQHLRWPADPHHADGPLPRPRRRRSAGSRSGSSFERSCDATWVVEVGPAGGLGIGRAEAIRQGGDPDRRKLLVEPRSLLGLRLRSEGVAVHERRDVQAAAPEDEREPAPTGYLGATP